MESQGPFDIIVHKLSDVIVEAEHDSQSQQLLDNFQSFVNHGAVLHKVFVVGAQHFTVQRPSLKNFPTGPY
ncbi:inositol-tetrakisphosphate 1-kinase-like isoform X2, partial [Clarias magur]